MPPFRRLPPAPGAAIRVRAPLRPLVTFVATIAALGATAWAAVPPATNRPPEPELLPDTTAIEASPELTWHVPALVSNHLPYGLYLDSLWLEMENLGPVDPGANRVERADLSGIVRAIGTIGGGDGAGFQFVHPAIMERAKLTFRLYTHDAHDEPHLLTMEIQAAPGVWARDCPSRTLEVGGRKVEFVRIPPTGPDRGPAPAVLVIHGHGASARPMIRAARNLAARGYWVGLFSQPGYGASEGPPDFMGPATLAAAEAALAELAGTEGVDRGRIAVWGFSRGATVAALLAARHPELGGFVVQAGIYDLWATWRGTTLDGFRDAIVAEAGRDSAAWRARSPLLEAKRLKVPALILHGERDTQVPIGQANAYAAAIRAAGTQAEWVALPNAGHVIPPPEATRRVFEFLERRIGR